MSALSLIALSQVRGIWIAVPHGFWGWLLIGLIAGWLAGKIARGRGFGCITDIILGIRETRNFWRRFLVLPRRCHAGRRDSRFHRPSFQRQ